MFSSRNAKCASNYALPKWRTLINLPGEFVELGKPLCGSLYSFPEADTLDIPFFVPSKYEFYRNKRCY